MPVASAGAVAYVLKTRTTSGGSSSSPSAAHGSPSTPDTARAEARRLLHVIAQGRDPAAERGAAEGADRRRPWPRDSSRRRGAQEARTLRDYTRLYERHIRPAFASFKLVELNRGRIAEWHSARVRTPVEANRALAVSSGCSTSRASGGCTTAKIRRPRWRCSARSRASAWAAATRWPGSVGQWRAAGARVCPPRHHTARHHRRPVRRGPPAAVGGCRPRR